MSKSCSKLGSVNTVPFSVASIAQNGGGKGAGAAKAKYFGWQIADFFYERMIACAERGIQVLKIKTGEKKRPSLKPQRKVGIARNSKTQTQQKDTFAYRVGGWSTNRAEAPCAGNEDLQSCF
jgi:hypothetical protein